MHSTKRRYAAFFLVLLAAFITLSFAYAAEEQITPKGMRPATKADLEWMKWAGLPEVKEGALINPDDPDIGKTAGETKKWLAEHAVKNVKIRCLNPHFAVKLKAFMEQVPGGPPVITDAYRSQADQQRIINKGDGATRVSTPCGSYHPFGLAADFNQNKQAQTDWMRANAQKFGFNTLGTWDPNHMQDARGRTGQCGACSADGPDGVLPPSSASPSTAVANAFRQLFGMQQQPVAQPQPILPPQPLPQAQSPLDAFKEPLPAPILNVPTPQLQPGASFTSSSSIADQLSELAFGTPVVTTTTTAPKSATSIPIIVNPRDIATISSTRTATETAPAQTGGGSIAQQTFTTQDLSAISESSNTGSNPRSAYAAILENLKATLIRMQQFLKPYLTPFGVRSGGPSQPDTVYLE